LIGCPPFSGFFSKDAILAVAYEHNLPIFAVALFTAFLTAFYVIRMLVIVFFVTHAARAHAKAASHRPS
jgi:NADH:ubiquinone oxidoreductase subunit 5 (chain L)/Multisubunit Na+/H+ antiporter, MnhA subunit